MKRTILVLACLALAAAGLAAQAAPPVPDDPFADFALLAPGAVALAPAELAAVAGDGINFFVDRAAQTMRVVTYNGATPAENYWSIKSYTVPVTTAVVRTQDVSPTLPRTAMVNVNKALEVPTQQNRLYNPAQFPSGTFQVTGASVPSDPRYGGTQLQTNARQSLPMLNPSGTPSTTNFSDTGYNIHYTAVANTNGCIGVRSNVDMNRISRDYNQYVKTGPATIKVY